VTFTDCVQLVTLYGGQRLTAYYFPLGLSIPWQVATIWPSQRQLDFLAWLWKPEATRRAVAGRNIRIVEDMNGPWAL
jgi:hypothetical protein